MEIKYQLYNGTGWSGDCSLGEPPHMELPTCSSSATLNVASSPFRPLHCRGGGACYFSEFITWMSRRCGSPEASRRLSGISPTSLIRSLTSSPEFPWGGAWGWGRVRKMPHVETQRPGVSVPAPLPRDCSIFSALVYAWRKLQFCAQNSAEPQGMFPKLLINCKVSKRQRNKKNSGSR